MLDFVGDQQARRNLLVESAVFKIVNRQKYLETSQDGVVEKDDVIVSLLADLQQEQDQESEKLVNDLQDKVSFSHLHLVTLAKKLSRVLQCFYFCLCCRETQQLSFRHLHLVTLAKKISHFAVCLLLLVRLNS